jgi:hypothetical protein
MKIIFLNIWNGKMGEPLRDFIAQEAPVTDVFCLEEVYPESKPWCDELLDGFTDVSSYKKGSEDNFALTTYVKDAFTVLDSGDILGGISNVGSGLFTEIKTSDGSLSVCNVHGLARPGEKLDNPDRIAQSRILIDLFRQRPGQKVIGGDFNILPDTESIRMFAKDGYVDLISAWNIPTTRNRLAWENYPGHELYYSDYVFVSPDMQVNNFIVLQNEISDHLPMILEVED